MKIHLTPDQKAEVEQAAKETDRSPEQFVLEAIGTVQRLRQHQEEGLSLALVNERTGTIQKIEVFT